MIPFAHERDTSYLEKLERQAQIARAEEAARLAGDLYIIGRAAVRVIVRWVKPAHHDAATHRDAAGRHA